MSVKSNYDRQFDAPKYNELDIGIRNNLKYNNLHIDEKKAICEAKGTLKLTVYNKTEGCEKNVNIKVYFHNGFDSKGKALQGDIIKKKVWETLNLIMSGGLSVDKSFEEKLEKMEAIDIFYDSKTDTVTTEQTLKSVKSPKLKTAHKAKEAASAAAVVQSKREAAKPVPPPPPPRTSTPTPPSSSASMPSSASSSPALTSSDSEDTELFEPTEVEVLATAAPAQTPEVQVEPQTMKHVKQPKVLEPYDTNRFEYGALKRIHERGAEGASGLGVAPKLKKVERNVERVVLQPYSLALQKPGKIDVNVRVFEALQLLRGLHNTHRSDIVHGNIKIDDIKHEKSSNDRVDFIYLDNFGGATDFSRTIPGKELPAGANFDKGVSKDIHDLGLVFQEMFKSAGKELPSEVREVIAQMVKNPPTITVNKAGRALQDYLQGADPELIQLFRDINS